MINDNAKFDRIKEKAMVGTAALEFLLNEVHSMSVDQKAALLRMLVLNDPRETYDKLISVLKE